MSKPPNRSGRPAVPEDRQATGHVVLERRHIEIVDEVVRLQLLGSGVMPSDQTARMVASERRRWLGEIIERRLEGRASLEISAPVSGTADEIRLAAEWMEREEELLEARAPIAIRRALKG